MEKIINILSNLFLWGIIILVLGWILKQKLNTYLRLIDLLIQAIEIIDDEIKDVIPDDIRQKLIKIKIWINDRLDKKDKEVLDTRLMNKGYLYKTEAK